MLDNGSSPPSLRVCDAALGALVAATAAMALIGVLSALTALTSTAAAAQRVQLKLEDASPRRAFFGGKRKVEFRYEIGGRQARDLVVKAVRRKNGRTVRRWRRTGVEPGVERAIRWNGAWRETGRAVPGDRYFFRVRERRGARADRAGATGRRNLLVRRHRFPVPARHSYADGFGAGRGHQGQDLFARCGKRVVAARGGRVQYRGRGGAAGNYVVIDGRRSRFDYVYMHLRRRGLPREGERVRTGERIGRVGSSGNASGCHLHFELWSRPGWYEGGRAKRSVTRKLRLWDRYS